MRRAYYGAIPVGHGDIILVAQSVGDGLGAETLFSFFEFFEEFEIAGAAEWLVTLWLGFGGWRVRCSALW